MIAVLHLTPNIKGGLEINIWFIDSGLNIVISHAMTLVGHGLANAYPVITLIR